MTKENCVCKGNSVKSNRLCDFTQWSSFKHSCCSCRIIFFVGFFLTGKDCFVKELYCRSRDIAVFDILDILVTSTAVYWCLLMDSERFLQTEVVISRLTERCTWRELIWKHAACSQQGQTSSLLQFTENCWTVSSLASNTANVQIWWGPQHKSISLQSGSQ